jgi:hypothetical protein
MFCVAAVLFLPAVRLNKTRKDRISISLEKAHATLLAYIGKDANCHNLEKKNKESGL